MIISATQSLNLKDLKTIPSTKVNGLTTRGMGKDDRYGGMAQPTMGTGEIILRVAKVS